MATSSNKLAFFLAGTAVFLVLIFASGPKVVDGFVLKFLGDVFNQAFCPAKHQSKFENCFRLVNPIYQAFFEEDTNKGNCCSRQAFKDCMTLITRIFCGEITSNVHTFLIKILDGIFFSTQCNAYTSIMNCTDPVLLFLIVLVSILFILCLVKGIFTCISSFFCNNNNNRDYNVVQGDKI